MDKQEELERGRQRLRQLAPHLRENVANALQELIELELAIQVVRGQTDPPEFDKEHIKSPDDAPEFSKDTEFTKEHSKQLPNTFQTLARTLGGMDEAQFARLVTTLTRLRESR